MVSKIIIHSACIGLFWRQNMSLFCCSCRGSVTVLAVFRSYSSGVTMSAGSCEPHRGRAYDADLKWRMVYQREMLGLTYEEIATNLWILPLFGEL